jgi:hypothetical protein
MTPEELRAYVESLPPDARAGLLRGHRVFRDYLAKAHFVRERIRQEFPDLNPRLRAVVSFIAARIL